MLCASRGIVCRTLRCVLSIKSNGAKRTEGLSSATALQAYKYEYISLPGLPVACIGKIYYLFKGPYFHSSLLAGMLIRSCITLAEETQMTAELPNAKARPPVLTAVYCSRRRAWVAAMTPLHIRPVRSEAAFLLRCKCLVCRCLANARAFAQNSK